MATWKDENHICGECRWWAPSNEDDDESSPENANNDYSFCRRYPPVFNATIAAIHAADVQKKKTRFERARASAESPGAWYYPVTHILHWCGEFQRIPLPTVEEIPS